MYLKYLTQLKTLTNHILIFDKDCPLCTIYTKLFVKYGFLDDKGRQAYQDMDFENTNVDTDLARNQIALLNTTTGEAIYGIDALTKVLSNKFSFIGLFMKFKPLYWLMTQLYSLISYNRKIVIPVSCNNLTSCNPSKNWFWRILFILICGVAVQLVYPLYMNTFFEKSIINTFYLKESLLLVGQLIFQRFFCILLKEKNSYDYIGHVSFISFMATLYLICFYVLLKILSLMGIETTLLGIICYGIVSGWMFLEHRRRMNILGMNKWLTWSWVLYKIIVFGLVFSLV